MYKMAKAQSNESSQNSKNKKCGIIMPIAAHPDYPNDHWADVLEILTDAIKTTEFEPRLVSDDVAIGLIHDRIVTNIYNDDIVVCDVSSKNPNVMFELGLRLAFDKPTIIIKDEKTGYSFDTGVIEHLSYPSSLRFNKIVDFKAELIKRINATYEKAKKESNYSPFLKSFGKTIVPATIDKTEIPEGKYILEQLDILRNEIRLLRYDRNDSVDNLNNLNRKFKLNDNTFKLLLDSTLKRIDASKLEVNDEKYFYELRNELRSELANTGIDISNSELQKYLYDYINSYVLLKSKK
jgi:hypothetical protein